MAVGAGIALSGYMGSKAAGKAAGAQGDAAIRAAEIQAASADRAGDIQLQMFQEGQEATAPWRETGAQALGGLADIYGLGGEGGRERAMEAFQAGPAYQWQVDEAAKASDAAAAAGGRFKCGSQIKAIQKLRQKHAKLEIGKYNQ